MAVELKHQREQRIIDAQVEAMVSAVHRTMADMAAKDLFNRVAHFLVPELLKSNAFAESLDSEPKQGQKFRARATA